MQLFAGEPVTSDALKILRAIGAFSAAAAKSRDGASAFMESHFLRPKAIEEINRLRVQLSNLVRSSMPKDTVGLKTLSTNATTSTPSVIPPPSLKDTAVLRQILLAGFPDHIARYDAVATKTALGTGAKNIKPIYSTMWSSKTDVFTIHASSSLARVRPAPQWIIYEEVVGVEERLTADNTGLMFTRPDSTVVAVAAVISEEWIAKIGPKSLLKPGKLMEQPVPRYDMYKDKVVGFSAPNYGPKVWELPTMEVDVDLKNGVQYFAMALLEGAVKPGRLVKKQNQRRAKRLRLLRICLVSYCNHHKVMVKIQSRVNGFLSALMAKNICSRAALERIWFDQPSFLLAEYLAWLPTRVKMPPPSEKSGIPKKLAPFLAQLPQGNDLRRREMSAAAAQDSGEDSD
ncbi:hypothetical protein BDR26DRAFT_895268 [Obelidium mucronatum]|nr:hypothetical protein BDR26DRAFT_895268 [Obelidium mucronatum]